MGEAQGKKIASKPLRGKAGERSDGIVARDAPVKRPAWTRGHQQFVNESARSQAFAGDATSPHRQALRCISTPSALERTGGSDGRRPGDNKEGTRMRPKHHCRTRRPPEIGAGGCAARAVQST
jgi:hypothetical protein